MRNSEDLLLAFIAKYPEGVSISEILSSSGVELGERTVQRHLNALIDKNAIERRGKSRAAKYYLIVSEETTTKKLTYEPISKAAKEVKSYLSHPVKQRKKVDYNPTFLEAYQPNTSFYLSEQQRQTLHDMGQQKDHEDLMGTFAHRVFDRLLIDLSFHSSQLEGNTYSLLETQRLLVHSEISEGKSTLDAQMILNHKAAIEFLVEEGGKLQLNRFTLFNLHALLADNLLANPNALGNIRKIPVGIGKTAYQPIAIPQVLEDTFHLIDDKANAITDPFEQSFFLLVHIPYLQAFEDVNKRTSRLAANIPLIKNNLCPLSFVGVNKQDYIDAVLGIYELNDVSLLAEFYIWLYSLSVKRYTTVRDQLPAPDRFKIHYRQEMIALINLIVEQMVPPESAERLIQSWVQDHIVADDQARFKELVERDLVALHMGNIARFKISTKQFKAWAKLWKINLKSP